MAEFNPQIRREKLTFDPDDDFDQLLIKMKKISDAKGHDYAENEDRLSNFRMSEQLGISPWIGILVRIGDKYSRLSMFAKKGTLKVSDESIEDTFIDLANYALLGLMAYQEQKEPKYSDVLSDDR